MSKKKSQSLTVRDEVTQFLLYTAPGGGVKVEVILNNETIWLTQQQIADLFGVARTSISRHLKNIFECNELNEDVVCAEIAHTTQHGAIPGKTQTQPVKYYNLDAVISVGYRVNSIQATQFRIWATQTLKEYIIKGFAMDDERLKNGRYFGKDYFRELQIIISSQNIVMGARIAYYIRHYPGKSFIAALPVEVITTYLHYPDSM